MSVWLWVVAAFLAGGLVGAGITALLKRGSDVEQRMRRLRREYEQYQAEVARHFSQTGELLSRLRTSFDQLYNEVEERATALVAEEALQRRLEYLDENGRGRGRRPASPPGAPPRTVGDDRATSPGFGATGPAQNAGTAPGPGAPSAPAEPGSGTGGSEDGANDVPDDESRR